MVYLASPIDLIPDFIPLVGYLDDLLLAALVIDGILNWVDRGLILEVLAGLARTRSSGSPASPACWPSGSRAGSRPASSPPAPEVEQRRFRLRARAVHPRGPGGLQAPSSVIPSLARDVQRSPP